MKGRRNDTNLVFLDAKVKTKKTQKNTWNGGNMRIVLFHLSFGACNTMVPLINCQEILFF